MRKLISLALLLFAPTVWATTRTICASGCDDTTIASCESNSSPSDTCQINDTRTYAENITADQAGWTLTVQAGSRHDGTAGSGPVINPSAGGHAFTISADNITIEYIECYDLEASSDECFRVNDGSDNFTLNNVICRPTDVDDQEDCVFSAGDTTGINVNNLICYDCGRACIHAQPGGGGYTQTWTIKNALMSCGAGIAQAGIRTNIGGGDTVTINLYSSVLFDNDGESDIYEAGTAATWNGDYNYCEDGDSELPGGNSDSTAVATDGTCDASNDLCFTNLTGGSEDFTLQDDADNALINGGDDSNSTATDAIDATRDSGGDGPDAGPLENVAGGAPAAAAIYRVIVIQ